MMNCARVIAEKKAATRFFPRVSAYMLLNSEPSRPRPRYRNDLPCCQRHLRKKGDPKVEQGRNKRRLVTPVADENPNMV